MEPIEVYTIEDYTVEIFPDFNPLDPMVDFDFLSTFFCFHKRYNLGHEHDYDSDMFDGWDYFADAIERDHEVWEIKPLYLYDHSGITISNGSFASYWDSSQIGWQVVTEASVEKMGTPEERISKVMKGELKTYDAYLRGDVYGFSIEENGEQIDSCMGYYDLVFMKSEIESIIKNRSEIKRKENQEKLKSLIRHSVPLEARV